MSKEKFLKVHFFVFCLLSCFPLFSMRATPLLIIAFFALSLFAAMFDFKNINWKLSKELLVYILPFLFILVWTSFIDRSPEGDFYLERSLSLAAFPLAFFLFPVRFSDKQKDIFQLLFVGATLLEVVYGMVATGVKFVNNVGPGQYFKSISELVHHDFFPYLVRTTFEEKTYMHPTYASLYLGLAFLFLFHRFLKHFSELTFRKKSVYVFTLILLIIFQVILASRTPFAGTLFAAFVLYFINLKRKIYILWAGLVIIAGSIIFFISVPSFSKRFKEVSVSNNVMPTKENHDSFNIRKGIYSCSVELIKNNWLFGVGPGKIQGELNACYNNISEEVYKGENFNTHNQFMDYWAGMGILAPLSLLYLLFYVSYHNSRQRIYFPFIICILFFISMLTENILIRQNGVVVFSFFLSLYCFNTKEPLKLTLFNKEI